MRVTVFGLKFASKKALAQLLGCSYRYSPRRRRGVNVKAKEMLTERDIMKRFNFESKEAAGKWLRAKLEEAQNNASAID